MVTWRSLAGQRGKIRQMFAIWIHNRYREIEKLRAEDKRRLDNGEITPEEYNDLIEKDHAYAFTLREIMEAHGMDYEKRADYVKAYSALAMERKQIEAYFGKFLDEGGLEKSRKEGKSDDLIWGDFITAANSWNIHLLYSDPDGRYKQIDLYSYATLVNRRLLAMDRELRTKGEQVRLIGKALPELIPSLKPPELDGFKDRHRMLVAHAWSCPFCPDLTFPDENECKKHLEEVHKASSVGDSKCIQTEISPQLPPETDTPRKHEFFRCPICRTGELRLLQHGDFKCTECRTIISKEDFKKFFPEVG